MCVCMCVRERERETAEAVKQEIMKWRKTVSECEIGREEERRGEKER